MLANFTYKMSRSMELELKASDLLENETIKDRIYGVRPVEGARCEGITYDRDGIRWNTKTSTVAEVYPLSWAVGFIGGEDIARWWLARTRSGTLYAVAELK